MVSLNRKRMDPGAAALGFSAYQCEICGQHFSKRSEHLLLRKYFARCQSCGEDNCTDSVGVTILPRYTGLLRKGEVFSRTWWHATRNEDWLGELRNYTDRWSVAPMVHVGSRESAAALANLKWNEEKGAKWYINKIEIKPTSALSGNVVDDDNWWPEDTRDLESKSFDVYSGITRYVNRYEIPGSISLVADYRLLTVTETRRLTRAEIGSTLAAETL